MSRLTQWLFDKPHVKQGEVFAALDIGSSKIACFIARAEGDGPPRVIGIGHQVAEGMKNGSVANMEALQHAISSAVATAEQMAGEMLERVIVNVSGPQLLSQTVNIELPINGREVTESDLQRINAQGQTMVPEDAQGHPLELIHTIPVTYSLDHQKGIRDPIGMTGSMLSAQLHLVSAAFGPVRTLVTAIARCHLDVEKIVAAPYASGLACLVEDEMDLGTLVIDMGAGTTSFSVFFDGSVVYTDGIPVGGAHVTNDIARGLTTSLSHAERLKTLYGNAVPSAMDEREIIDVPQVGEEAPEHSNHVSKGQLIRIIQPRLEEIFEMVRQRMDRSGFNEMAGRRVVLTGGASQMPGVRELAQRVLDRQIRLGRPLRVARPLMSNGKAGPSFTGLAEATSGPAFATTAGLLVVAMQPELAASNPFSEFVSGVSKLSRIGQWLKQNM
ncbi:MAG: cell division protein FtsA [Alphaproteobacteria bacterium]